MSPLRCAFWLLLALPLGAEPVANAGHDFTVDVPASWTQYDVPPGPDARLNAIYQSKLIFDISELKPQYGYIADLEFRVPTMYGLDYFKELSERAIRQLQREERRVSPQGIPNSSELRMVGPYKALVLDLDQQYPKGVSCGRVYYLETPIGVAEVVYRMTGDNPGVERAEKAFRNRLDRIVATLKVTSSAPPAPFLKMGAWRP